MRFILKRYFRSQLHQRIKTASMAELAPLMLHKIFLFVWLLTLALSSIAQVSIEELGADGASEVKFITPIIREPDLITAIKEEDPMRVERLVKKKGVNIDERSPTGWTALMVASTRNDLSYVKLVCIWSNRL
jgi:hypothetical protein